MKALYNLFLCCGLCLTATAQIEPGQWLLSGSFSADSDSDGGITGSTTGFNSLSGTVGISLFKQITQKNAWGGSIFVFGSSQDRTYSSGSDDEVTNQLGLNIGPSFRTTYTEWKAVNVYSETDLAYTYRKNEFTNFFSQGSKAFERSTTSHGAGISIRPGLQVKISERFLATASFILFSLDYSNSTVQESYFSSLDQSVTDQIGRVENRVETFFFPSFSFNSLSFGVVLLLGPGTK
ncbi:MAG: hypothetical protein SFY70_05560 [Bacteroidia bacterium]|nr:hypothetical protein [Bacteroidia bacterium]